MSWNFERLIHHKGNDSPGEVSLKIGRFDYNGNILYGRVEGERVQLWEGNPFSEYTESKESVPLSRLKALIPVTPSKIVCVGQNYREHIKELGVPVPEEPVIFLKPPSCLVGPDEPILYPPQAARVDYEGELALIIKEPMKDIPTEDTLRFLLGVSCFNDVTERSMAQKDPFLLTLSKGFDTFGAFGPYIATGLNPDNLRVKTYLNGDLRQDDTTANCVFDVKYILSFVSRVMTLLPGDVVITGTPKGIGPMKAGDLIEVEVEGVGRLTNTVKPG
jgi:2-keto-4-pentenoate hydratase/2-oxohepta-3-ene-1,7-dioic acid hydratase in catechol pathway